MRNLEELNLNETKEVEIRIYGPGVVIIEEMFFSCMGQEDLEFIDENANELDVYYETQINEDVEAKIYRLEEVKDDECRDYFDPFKAILRRIK